MGGVWDVVDDKWSEPHLFLDALKLKWNMYDEKSQVAYMSHDLAIAWCTPMKTWVPHDTYTIIYTLFDFII